MLIEPGKEPIVHGTDVRQASLPRIHRGNSLTILAPRGRKEASRTPLDMLLPRKTDLAEMSAERFAQLSKYNHTGRLTIKRAMYLGKQLARGHLYLTQS